LIDEVRSGHGVRALPVLQRREAAAVLEGPREVRQAVEAALLADRVDRKVEAAQQALRVLDPDLDQVVAEAHTHLGPEQVREVARRQVDRLGHLVAVDVLVEMRQHVATSVLGAVVLERVRGVDRVALVVDQDDLGQRVGPEVLVAGNRVQGRVQGGRPLAVGQGIPGDAVRVEGRGRHAVQELGHEVSGLDHVGLLGHQNRCVGHLLILGQDAAQRIGGLGRVHEDESGRAEGIGDLPLLQPVHQDLRAEEREAELRRVGLGLRAEKENPLTLFLALGHLFRIGRKLYHETGPGFLNCFEPFFHQSNPHPKIRLGQRKVVTELQNPICDVINNTMLRIGCLSKKTDYSHLFRGLWLFFGNYEQKIAVPVAKVRLQQV